MEIHSIEKVDIPDGIYPAIWVGYSITLYYYNKVRSESIKVSGGIRGMSRVGVTIKDNVLYVNY